MRRIWGVPLTTHSILLPLISQCLNVFDEICRRVFNFIFSCCYSKYKLIRDVAFHGLKNAGYSLIGSNFSFVCRHFGFKRLSKITARSLFSSRVMQYSDDETRVHADLLRDIISLRDSSLPSPFLQSELLDILNFICTN